MAAAAPTGCFKCGRPSHWSRDCPSSAPAADDAPTNPSHPSAASGFNAKPRPSSAAAAPEGDGTYDGAPPQPLDGNGKKKKKERTKRPKLTPDLLLSDGGIGFVLRYFPKSFKPRARPGHEVEDLGNLIKLYADWHSRLIPYYSFEQFVRKVEKLGAGNRVRRCVSELRDRVARGGDPTLLHEPPIYEDMPEGEPDGTAPEDSIFGTEAPLSDNHVTDPVQEDADPPMKTNDVDPMEEDLLNEIYEKTADEPWIPAGEGTNKEVPEPLVPKEVNSLAQKSQDGAASDGPKRVKIELTEEQKARMEANRLKALEREQRHGLVPRSPPRCATVQEAELLSMRRQARLRQPTPACTALPRWVRQPSTTTAPLPASSRRPGWPHGCWSWPAARSSLSTSACDHEDETPLLPCCCWGVLFDGTSGDGGETRESETPRPRALVE